MSTRQTTAGQWLIVNESPAPSVLKAVRKLPASGGVLVFRNLDATDLRHLKMAARMNGRRIVVARRDKFARVHNARELTRALLGRPEMILVSPIYETVSHPDWKRLPRMRAAALARMCGRNAVALGGMDRKRFARIAPLGFTAWAGISAFRT
jgi:thiamine-phosphate pyrophosphorylase